MQHGTVETHAKPVEKAQFDAVDDTGRQVTGARFGGKSCKFAGGAREQWSL